VNNVSLDVIILAAGVGSRMNSDLPKALQQIASKPMLTHLIDTALNLNPNNIHIVVGHLADQIKNKYAEQTLNNSTQKINFVMQSKQLGTAHAVKQAMPYVKSDLVLVLYADVPLIKLDTLHSLVALSTKQSLALLTVKLDNPTGYGRIIRNNSDQIIAIVEHKDANQDELTINEVNTGILATHTHKLHKWLDQVNNNNSQQEYYLTDIVNFAKQDNYAINGIILNNDLQVQGANNKAQLVMLERYYQQTKAQELLQNGVTLYDDKRIDIRGNLTTGKDVSIDINCIFIGNVSIGSSVTIEAGCIIKDSVIGDNCLIKANSNLEGAIIASNVSCGPFARIRQGTKLHNNVKVGNFVEIKKAELHEGVKAGHLSYLGDAIIGKNSNIGAGTISCNYDGTNKHQTIIGDNNFIGSNTSLVAPVELKNNVTIAAGSVITKNVPKNNLAVARSRQSNISNWKNNKD